MKEADGWLLMKVLNDRKAKVTKHSLAWEFLGAPPMVLNRKMGAWAFKYVRYHSALCRVSMRRWGK